MPLDQRLYVIEDRRRRVIAPARDAGHARLLAALLLHGCATAPERDALVVREPEEEEITEFEARRAGPAASRFPQDHPPASDHPASDHPASTRKGLAPMRW